MHHRATVITLLLCAAAAAGFVSPPGVAAREGDGEGEPTSCTMMSSTKADRVAGAMWGLFAGDAIAMPAHWYYNLGQLKHDFGTITGYHAPPERLPGSILSLSSTGTGGRGSTSDGNVIGDVINHGKAKYWVRGGDYHYHHSLAKGENTLDAQIARVAIRSMTATAGAFSARPFVQDFVQFMTTPGSHNDTYAGTYLRMYFENFARGVPPSKCPGNDGHNVDTIDALTVCGPVAIAGWARGLDRTSAAAEVEEFLRSTRKSDALPRFGQLYTEMIFDVLDAPAGADSATVIRAAAVAAADKVGLSLVKMVAQHPGDSNPMVACYIDSAFPAMLIILHKYADDPAACLLASANAGGENVARGAVLGTLMGAAVGKTTLPRWMIDGLLQTAELEAEIAGLQRAVEPIAAAGNL